MINSICIANCDGYNDVLVKVTGKYFMPESYLCNILSNHQYKGREVYFYKRELKKVTVLNKRMR